MWCPDDLKLNRFRVVKIPRPRDYFRQFGFSEPKSSGYSGDVVIPPAMTKNEQCAESLRAYQQYSREEDAKAREGKFD